MPAAADGSSGSGCLLDCRHAVHVRAAWRPGWRPEAVAEGGPRAGACPPPRRRPTCLRGRVANHKLAARHVDALLPCGRGHQQAAARLAEGLHGRPLLLGGHAAAAAAAARAPPVAVAHEAVHLHGGHGGGSGGSVSEVCNVWGRRRAGAPSLQRPQAARQPQRAQQAQQEHRPASAAAAAAMGSALQPAGPCLPPQTEGLGCRR